MLPEVAVVILNYNTRGLLEQFIPMVLASNYPNLRLVVADNASTDGSADWVQQHYPNVQLIRLSENLGYAAGYNQALQQVHTPYYVLLNSDVEVTPGWLEPLVHMMLNNPNIAACQPKIRAYHQRESFEYAGASGGWIDAYGYPFCRGRVFDTLEEDLGQYDNPAEVFWASGACLMIHADRFHETGGFDPDFFAHMEEIDLCWRLKNEGFEIWACPLSTVYHMGGGTLAQQSPRKTYLNFRNGLALLAKNLPSRKLFPVILWRLVLDHVAAYRFLFKGDAGNFKAVAKAHYHFLTRTKYWKKKRRHSQQPYPLTGMWPHSLVQAYFLGKRRKFTDLVKPD